jgi:ribonuclease PH
VEKLLKRHLLETTPILDHVAAVSVGIYAGVPVLDLDYPEDSSCDTDMNVVMTGGLGLVEVQGTAEGVTFDRQELNAMLDLAQQGIQQLIALQKAALAEK